MAFEPALGALDLAHRVSSLGFGIQRREMAVPCRIETLLDDLLCVGAAAEIDVATRDRRGDRRVTLLRVGHFLPRLVERARVVRLAPQAFGERVSTQLRALVGV